MQDIDPNVAIAVLSAIGAGVGAYFTYRLGLRQADKDQAVGLATAESGKDASALSLIEESFEISQKLQDALKRDIDDLRTQIKDTQGLVDLLVAENKKLMLENDKLQRANQLLTEENNMLLKENKKLSEQILEVTSRMGTLEQAIHAAPPAMLEG